MSETPHRSQRPKPFTGRSSGKKRKHLADARARAASRNKNDPAAIPKTCLSEDPEPAKLLAEEKPPSQNPVVGYMDAVDMKDPAAAPKPCLPSETGPVELAEEPKPPSQNPDVEYMEAIMEAVEMKGFMKISVNG